MNQQRDEEDQVPAATAVSRRRRRRSQRVTPTASASASPPPQARSTPAPNPAAPGLDTASASSVSDAAIAEVLVVEEAARARGFSLVIAVVCLCVAGALPLLAGDPLARLWCGVALAIMGLSSLRVFRLTGTPQGAAVYGRSMHRSYGLILTVGVLFVEYYTGLFSPVPVVLALGIYYFGQANDRTDALVLPSLVIASYAVLGMLVATSVLHDRGLFTGLNVSLGSRVFAVTAVTLVLGATLRMAQVARAALREAIERSQSALLLAQQREAQLAEAHHQLDRAMRVAVGKPGRYTGVMAGQYRLGIVIGIGAIGEVYSAEHQAGGDPAAVKLLQAAALEREDLIERILREGSISRRLAHPHVVRVFEVGRLGDGAPYLTMELLRGCDLAARLRQEGQLAGDELERLAREVGAGLQHAHDHGIVHRDLKPLNIYEATHDHGTTWKILDFGISKLATSGGTLTQEGVIGTPGYMSPEQARGAEVDHHSDVFSMAVVLYRAMTGQPAFPGQNTPQILFDIVYRMPQRPSLVARHVPSDVDLVMAVALAKEPSERFQSAAEFADAFVQAWQRSLSAELRARGQARTRKHAWSATLQMPGAGDAPAGT